MGVRARSRVIQIHPTESITQMKTHTPRDVVRRATFKAPVLVRDIMRPLDLMTAFVGNVRNTEFYFLSRLGLVLWVVSVALKFSFDGFEASVRYQYAWVAIKAFELSTVVLGTYYLVAKAMPWMRNGMRMLEDDGTYRVALGRVGVTSKKLQIIVVVFISIAASLEYVILRLDKADHVTFKQTTSTALWYFMHVCRFVTGLHVLYAHALLWFIPTCIMLITGHSMIEYQQRMRAQLRKKNNKLTIREAVQSFNDRIVFARNSSHACVVVLMLLLMVTLASVLVNAYVYLYKNRYNLYIWHALMPLALAIYPMSTAAWVTKQYHNYFVVVVKAWVERPESDSESDSESEPSTNVNEVKPNRRPSTSLPSDLRIHMPTMGYVSVGDQSDHTEADRLQRLFVGSARAVGKWQRTRKLPHFNFEKYIAYLHNVAPSTGFKISALTVTWERVSATFFLIISVVALFLQETIFGGN
ncbi:uncharacterized protein LOC116610730 [Nematostella vectensis]|uniref:uncharacterized protein LOC116610730 n=1 Tax=Nematostella vectensis TaxID=45351 RepID=UPI00138F9E3B|nr:uncharacterized protein LOC116610730 [Nematostella vectensis]